MADDIDATNTDGAADDADEKDTKEPETMDDIIDKEAEVEEAEERGDDEDDKDDKSDDSVSDKDDDADADAEGEESDEDGESDEDEDEEVEDEEEEPEPLDKTKLTEVGMDAIPDDYKPTSWKGMVQDVVDVIRGEVNKENLALTESQEEFKREVASVDQGWQNEIGELQKSGDLPKDEKELETATKEVFEFMAKNNEKYADNPNKQIWSFETAFKLKGAGSITEERKKEIKGRRKARASAASGAEGGGDGDSRPRVIKGMSMDDIIEQEFDE